MDGLSRGRVVRHAEARLERVRIRHGDAVAEWALAHGQRLAERCERIGETVFCYTRDAHALLQNLEARHDLRTLHRQANLEDVFLKLTGRELRD